MTEEISIKSFGLTLASLMSECEQADFDKVYEIEFSLVNSNIDK